MTPELKFSGQPFLAVAAISDVPAGLAALARSCVDLGLYRTPEKQGVYAVGDLVPAGPQFRYSLHTAQAKA
jgi:hypothetical protein